LKTWRNGSNRWTATLAALLFALQVLFTGLAGSAQAHDLPRDQFGNVICSPADGSTAHAGMDDAGHSSGKLDCCTLGCPMVGGAMAPPPTLNALLVRQPLVRTAVFVLFEDVGTGAVETPRQTRGPPLSI
jgi:hypothetical protein